MTDRVALLIATVVGILTIAAISSELTFWVVRKLETIDDRLASFARRLSPIERWYRSHQEGPKDE